MKTARRECGFEIKFAAGAPDGTFSGYGAVFGNVDSYGDVIERGAFKETLRDWESKGKWPPMLLQHGGGFFGGSADDLLPIGAWTSMEENSKGLKVEGVIDPLDTDQGKKIYAGLKHRGLDGLSIGYNVTRLKEGAKPTDPRRTIEELDLVELSIVTFPANDRALVSSVKAAIDALNPRELERLFKQFLSRDDAVRAVATVKKHLQREAEGHPLAGSRDEEAAVELLSTLKALRAA